MGAAWNVKRGDSGCSAASNIWSLAYYCCFLIGLMRSSDHSFPAVKFLELEWRLSASEGFVPSPAMPTASIFFMGIYPWSLPFQWVVTDGQNQETTTGHYIGYLRLWTPKLNQRELRALTFLINRKRYSEMVRLNQELNLYLPRFSLVFCLFVSINGLFLMW